MTDTSAEQPKCCFTAEEYSPTRGCQFKEENEFFDVDGKLYCRFHMPIESASGELSPKVNWSDAEYSLFEEGALHLANKSTRLINLTGVKFPRLFDFSTLAKRHAKEDSERSKSDLQVKKSCSLPAIDARRTHFVHSVKLERIKFMGAVDFSGAIFSGSASFDRSTFKEGAFFNDAIFEHASSFRRAKFKKIQI